MIKTKICKLFKINTLWLSGEIIYIRKGIYYSSLSKAVFRKIDSNYQTYIQKRLLMGESKYFEEIGKAMAKWFEEGIKGVEEDKHE